MSFLPSLPTRTNLADVLKAFPGGWVPILEAHDTILRGQGALSIGERELVAAYVSKLNGCLFCTNAHTVYAEAYGFPPEVTAALGGDLAAMPVEERLRPILAYARVLTVEPAGVTERQVQAILDAGWPEQAVADVAMVVALFNFMNRIVQGFGVDPFAEHYARRLADTRARPLEERQAANQRDVGSHHYRQYGEQLKLAR